MLILVILIATFLVLRKLRRGYSPLHYAAIRGKVKGVRSLLASGADVDVRTRTGLTPLHLAAECGKSELAKLLISGGADLEARSYYRLTPLHRAALKNQCDIIELLIQNGASTAPRNAIGHTPLHCAAEGGHVAAATLLIDSGARVNARGLYDETPLHLAAYRGHKALVELLVAKDAFVDAEDSRQFTPESCAEMARHYKIARFLESTRSEPPAFDAFISYKSEDAAFVRRVVDQLVAAGYSVWFAEYEILTPYDWKYGFSELMSEGVSRSMKGIAFTSAGYPGSNHCRTEAQQMLDHCGKENIIQVSLDGTDVTALEGVTSMRCNTKDIAETVAFISKCARLDVDAFVAPRSHPPDYYRSGTGAGQFQLNIGGWQLDSAGEQLSVSSRAHEGPTLHRYVLSMTGKQVVMRMNLYCGIDQEYPNPPNPRPGIESEDADRALYYELLSYADERHSANVAKTTGAELKYRGVHLVHHGGRGHLALTYRISNYWSRKLSIHLPRVDGAGICEFVFTFGFFGSFRDYCRNAHLMDELALSLQWVDGGGLSNAQSTGY